MRELIENVKNWAEVRGLKEQDPSIQWMRVTEEVGEIRDALIKPDAVLKEGKFATIEDALKDGIGDSIVTLIVLAYQLDLDVEECLQVAYDEIKDRQGEIVNGTYIKKENLPYDFEFTGFVCGPDEIREVSPEQTLDAVVEDDVVNNPSHYQGRNGLEAIEVVREFAPCPEYVEGGYWFNTLKYLLRYHKKNGVEDLKKARKNLDWLIEELEK